MAMDYVWYAGYGSNLHKQRFLCYIEGGTPCFGKRRTEGCKDTTLPGKDRRKDIPYQLYFALPQGQTTTGNWGEGGVAFIHPNKDDNAETHCRMWKITTEQYEEVKRQEGRGWYNKEISLGTHDDIPIYTITNGVILGNIISPSEAYVKTIALGLRETCGCCDEQIFDYLIKVPGIQFQLQAFKQMLASIGQHAQ